MAGKRDMQNDDIQDMKWIPIGRYALYPLSTVSDCFCCFIMMNKFLEFFIYIPNKRTIFRDFRDLCAVLLLA